MSSRLGHCPSSAIIFATVAIIANKIQRHRRGSYCADSKVALPNAVSADVAIIGGGIAGVSLAYHLRTRASTANVPTVVLLEKESCGSAATGLSAGTIWNAGRAKTLLAETKAAGVSITETTAVFDTIAEACARTVETLQEIDSKHSPTSFTASGCLTLAVTSEEVESINREYTKLSEAGYNVDLVRGAKRIRELEPALRGTVAQAALHTPLSGYVDPLIAVVAIAEAAQAEGTMVLESNKVVALMPIDATNDAAIKTAECGAPRFRISTSSGLTVLCKTVVVAGGISAPSILLLLEKEIVERSGVRYENEQIGPNIAYNLHIPVYPVKGNMWETHQGERCSAAAAVKKVIYVTESHLAWEQGNQPHPHIQLLTHDIQGRERIRHCYGRPRGDGSVVFGGGRMLSGAGDHAVDAASLESSYQQVTEIYPRIRELGRTGAAYSGLMPFSADGLPLVGSLCYLGPQFEGAYIAGGFGGEGIMQAPGTMQFLARDIVRDLRSNHNLLRQQRCQLQHHQNPEQSERDGRPSSSSLITSSAASRIRIRNDLAEHELDEDVEDINSELQFDRAARQMFNPARPAGIQWRRAC